MRFRRHHRNTELYIIKFIITNLPSDFQISHGSFRSRAQAVPYNFRNRLGGAKVQKIYRLGGANVQKIYRRLKISINMYAMIHFSNSYNSSSPSKL